MTDVPVQVIVAAFRTETDANTALDTLKRAQKEHLIRIDDAAIIRKDSSGKLHLHETGDMGGGKGLAIGGVTGAVVGLLAGPVGWAAGIGAVIGGLGANLHDAGFRDERLKQIGAGLTPGSSAIIAVVEHTWVDTVTRQLQQEGADVVTAAIAQDVADQLNAGRDVAYSALSYAGVTGIERDTRGDTDASVSRLIATPEGVYAEGVAVDQETVAFGAGVVTAEGAAVITGEAHTTGSDTTATDTTSTTPAPTQATDEPKPTS
jgi:uncharacterized membrane protein